jgi:nitrite reductase/ring-hydroxylating ferredoxin subunit
VSSGNAGSAATLGSGARHRPTVVAHTGQLPDAGSFVTADAAGTPLLVVRQDDGSVRALANVCRHRGARVETEAAGRRKMFACPYHRWCYKRTGEIRSITFDDGFSGVPKAGLGLVEHPSAEAGNLVWVVPDRSEPSGLAVPAELARAGLVRGETLELDGPWTEVEARLTSALAAQMLTPGTFASWSRGWAEVITVRPAGARLDRAVAGFWLLADTAAGASPAAAGARWDERVARLRAVVS